MENSIFDLEKIKKIFGSRNLIILIFFVFGLIFTISTIFLNQNDLLKEKSGILGYYLIFILYQLFGSGSIFIGPIYLVTSIKSYLRQDLKYIQNAFLGSILFLFSFSYLLAFFEIQNSGFVGAQLFFLGNLLIGNISSLILAFIIFLFSILKIFSLDILTIKSFFYSLKEKKINFKFSYFLGILFLLLNYKNLLQIFKKKEKDSSENSKENQNMDFIKKIVLLSEKKPPWIQKVQFEEKKQISNDLNEEKESITISEQILENNDSKKSFEEENQNEFTYEISKKNSEIQEENQIEKIEDIKYNSNLEKIKIHYDSNLNRFVFYHNEDLLKKKIQFNELEQNVFLEDFELESDLRHLVRYNNKDLSIDNQIQKTETVESIEIFKEDQNLIQEQEIKNNFDKDFLEKEKEELNESIENNENFKKNTINFLNDFQESENKDFEISNQNTIENSKNKIENYSSLYNLNPEYYLKKLRELQEEIISSERIPSYRLRLENVRSGENSFISGITIQQEIQENWQRLEKVLNDFNIKAQVVGATRGPMITMFEIRLEPGVRVNRILGLQDEIRMNLAAVSIRIVAPIPGKTTIGIEVPNKTREFISLGDLIQKDSEFFTKKRDINIPLGKDVAGITRYIDLTKLPHLLIAGATGSGKSVFLNSIIASLLYQYSPEKIRFLMIDPKMVELKLYEGIPHLLYPVIIDTKLAEKALHWAVNEMENRYKLFSLTKCRDIRSYNEKIHNKQIEGSPIPYIVIFIDELADLMMIAPKEVEESIIRLTQKARAVGIHLVLATQRPSVDVITALIKANCPARVSFQVAQKVDSRIILDTNGAETLLGKGDMLYKSPSSTLPIRIQSPNITEEEIGNIVQETQKYGFFGYIELPEEKEVEIDFGFSEIDEELIEKAWKIILETGKTSTSYIQRRLRIGYNRAANIMEKLEEMGYLSPATNNKPREILRRE